MRPQRISRVFPSMLRIVVPIALLIVGLVAGWIGHAMVAVPPDAATVTLYDDWRLGCPKPSDTKGNCTLVQDIVDTKIGREIAHLTLVDTPKGRVLGITVPYDVLLPSGIGMQLGKDKVRVYPYKTCDMSGCAAQVSVTDDLIKAMRPQRDAKLLIAQLDNKVAALPFSLKGFATAEDAHTAFKAKQTSWLARVMP
jgi:invasion protein IalB